MNIFKLPDLGEGLPDAIIREWYVNVGDEVKVDQPLVAMETAKALVDVPSPYNGQIEKLYGDEGDTINTGESLIGFSGDVADDTREDKGTVVGTIEESSAVVEESATGMVATNVTEKRVKATPAVRMLAKQLGVDINQVIPSNGMYVSADDVKATIGDVKDNTPKAQAVKGKVLSGIKRAMVQSMTQSHQEIVPVSLCDDADIHAWDNQDVTVRLLRAIAAAAKQEPVINSHYHGATMSIETFTEVNVGMAVDTEHGLFVPVIKDINNQSDEQLRDTINRFKQQAKDKAIAQEDLKGATIMLSNFGAFAGKYANPIIVPPMVCILGVGRSRDSVVAHEGEMHIHKIMPLSVTVDHRAITGGEVTRFLKHVMQSLAQARID
jgi:2-oxoisovalerate dehydrogenase E2 component (dihydrolipoyl transacylase)